MGWCNRLRNLISGRRHSGELDEELAFHLEMRRKENLEAGMPSPEADRDARLRFGNFTLQKELTREASIPRRLDSLAQDLRYTLRSLRSGRASSALIVAALALGIGANTAIFSIAHALILRSLPVRDPAGLYNVRVGNFMSWGYIEADETFTYALWQDFTKRQDAMSQVFAWADARFDVVLRGDTKEVTGAFVSPGAFRTLGIDAVVGRTLDDFDERELSRTPVAMISYQFWEREFAADPAVAGRTLLLEGETFSIAGVAPRRFLGLNVGRTADVYLPLAIEPLLRRNDSAFPDKTRYWLTVFGRLRPDLPASQAKNRLLAISAPSMGATLPLELPERVRPQYLKQNFVLAPAASGISYVRTSLQLPIAILSGIVLLLLLLACFTAANLLLARATARQKEIAMRMALGASRGRIVRQLAIESLLLALAGAGAGLLLAKALAGILVRVSSRSSDPLALDLSLDAGVFLFTLGIAGVSALLFGLAPALRAAHIAPGEAFKGGSATVPPMVMRVRRLLLAGQIAVTLVLITGAVLFGATLRNLLGIESGFRGDDRVVLAELDLRRTRFPKDARLTFYRELLGKMERLPLVEAASVSCVSPISGGTWQFNVTAETPDGPKPVHIHFNGVTPQFFNVFGTRLLAGRGFTERDAAGAQAVAIVNPTLARKAFGTEDVIGRRISAKDPKPRTYEIVGIVQDAKYRSLRSAVPPTLYAPFDQFGEAPQWASVALRARGPASLILRDAGRVLTSDYPNLSFRLTTFRAQIDDSLSRERVFAMICALFGGLALALAAVGIYGVLSYLIERRRPEFGIRMSLGATPAHVRRLIYSQSLSTLAAGSAAGCLFAWWGARFTKSMLYGVTPAQPWVYAAAAGILGIVALAATLVPAARAGRKDVMDILRRE